MTTVLLLGFLIGLQHALEADHVSAVAALACRLNSTSGMIRQGVFWGIGHSLTLLAFAGIVFLFGQAIPPTVASWLETAVAVMLVMLGVDVLRRLRRENLHIHAHQHDGGVEHLHLHAHDETVPHDTDHDHEHAHVPWRTLLVGMMHGLAGSAALVVLAGGALGSPLGGIAYVALFGLGSVAGMAALSLVIAIPIGWSARSLTWANRSLQAAAGLAGLVLGGWVILGAATGPAFAF